MIELYRIILPFDQTLLLVALRKSRLFDKNEKQKNRQAKQNIVHCNCNLVLYKLL